MNTNLMHTALCAVLYLLLLVSGTVAKSAENLITDNALLDDGFENDDLPFEMEDTEPERQGPDSYEPFSAAWLNHRLIAPAHFTYRHELAYAIEDPQNLVINRSSLRLQWEKGQGRYYLRFDGKTDMDFVYNNSDDNQAVKNKYRDQSKIREFYIQASEGPYSIKLGRQLVIWGKADGAIVTDIMSPRDLTESVFTLLEDARIGQTMMVAELYLGSVNGQAQHQWSLIINPDIKVNGIPLAGHPYGVDLSLGLPIVSNKPGTNWRKPEVGLRWNVSAGKIDWSVMAAEVHEDNPLLLFTTSTQSPGIIKTDYPRYQMLGGGFNWSTSNFVWKGEIAFKKNRQFNHDNLLASSRKKVWDLALGFDYNANGAYTLSLELSNQHTLDWHQQLLNVRRDESVLYGIWSKTWLNETLTTQYTASVQMQDQESFHRVEFQYEFNDQWSGELQLDYFDSDEQNTALGRLNDKHRVSIQVDYDF